MRQLTGLFLSVILAFGASSASGQNGPVVVELYTSQGCSSCPPADEFLRQLAKRDDVIPMALHVDYWDYIGWKDTFGQAKFTKRQKGYARAAGKRMIYTPQMVIAGQEHVVGNKPGQVSRLIKSHKAQDTGIDLKVSRSGNKVLIEAEADRPSKRPMWVQLVRLRDLASVDIKRGENAGKKITYSNIVSDWQRIDTWDGDSPLSISRPVKGTDQVVVILQAADYGPILAAARTR